MKTIKYFFEGFKNGTREFGEGVNIVINSVLLSFVYVVGVGVTSVVARVKKKSFLEKSLLHTNSYWSELDLKKKPLEKYYRPY